VQGAMPDIGDVAGEERPGFPPVGAVIVRHLAELAGVEVYAGTLSPGGIIVSIGSQI